MAMCVISSPILVYSYSRKNNFYKFVLVFFAMYYLLLVSTHLYSRPFFKIVKYLQSGHSISQLREFGACQNFRKEYNNIQPCVLRNYIEKNIDKQDKILYFASSGDCVAQIMLLNFKGYTIDVATLEDIQNIPQYDKYIFVNDMQLVTDIRHFGNYNCAYFNLDDKVIDAGSGEIPYSAYCYNKAFILKENLKHVESFKATFSTDNNPKNSSIFSIYER
jgi:hypothetical protein